MSAKKIGAVIALDGEAKFNSAVRSCTKSLSTMDSEMKLVEAQTKGQANSLDTLTKKQEVLSKALAESTKKETEVQAGLKHSTDDYTRVGAELTKYKTQLSEAKSALDTMKSSGTATTEQIKEQQDKVDSLTKTVSKGEATYQQAGDRVEVWRKTLNSASTQTAEINNKIEENSKYLDEAKASTDGCATSIDNYGKSTKTADTNSAALTSTVSKFSVFSVASQYLDTMSQSMQTLMTSSLNAAKELDKGYDSIITKTGATGDSLQGMTDIANNLYSSLPMEMSDIGDAVGEVSTRFSESGDQLESTSKQYLEFASINNTDVSSAIDSTDRILTQFGVSTDEAGNYLGMLTKRSQETGKSVTDLMSDIDTNASTLKGLGLNLEQSTNLLSQFETAGIDSSTALRSLKTAVNNYAKEGKSATDGLNDTITSIKEAKTDTEALGIAQDTFGTKGAQAMTDAIREGRFSLDDLSDSMDNYSSTVEDTYNATLDPWDKLTVATNNLKEAGSDLAGDALETLQPAIEKVTEVIKDITKAYDNLESSTKQVIAVTASLAAGALYLAPKITKVVVAIKALKAANDATDALKGLSAGEEAVAASATTMGSTVTLGLGAFGAAVGVAAVIGGIVVAINNVTDASDWASSSSKDMMDNLSSAQSTLQSSMDTAASSLADVESTASIASSAVSELESLNSQTDKTAESQARMSSLVSELNSLYPDLNLQIDNQTGALSMTNQELEDYVNNLEKSAKAQAYQDAATESWDAVVKAETEANKADETYQTTIAKRKALETELKTINDEYSANQEKATQLQKEATQAYKDGSEKADGLQQEVNDLNSATIDYNGTQTTYSDALADVNAKLNDARETEKEQKDAVDTLNDSLDTATQTAQSYSDEAQRMSDTSFETADHVNYMSDAFNQTSDSVEGTTNALIDNVDENGVFQQTAVDVTNAVLTMQDNVSTALDSQMNMFEQFNGGTEISTQTLLDNMQSQIKGVKNWEANLSTLADRGINQDLLSNLESMGPKGANYVQAFVDMSDKEFSKANDLWSESVNIKGFTNSEGEQLTQGVAEMTAGGQDALNDLEVTLGAQAEESGGSVVDGLVNGMLNAKTASDDAATETGTSLLDNLNTSLGTHSPSTITYQSGLDVGAGLVNGLYGNKGAIEFAATDLSNTVINIMNTMGASADTYTAGLALSAGIVNGLYGNKDSVAFAATDIGATATTSMADAVIPDTAFTSGQTLSAYLVNGVYSNKGSVTASATDIGTTATTMMATNCKSATVSAAGQALSAGLVDGIYSNKDSVTFAGSDVGSSATSSMAGSVGSCFSEGENLSNSLASGIYSGRSAVINAAASVASSAITAANKTLQVNSPSKVFIKIGKSVDEGFSKGIIADAGTVTSAVEDTMNFSDFTATSPAYSALGAAGSAAVYNLYIDGIKYNTDDYIDGTINDFVMTMLRKGQMYSG